MKARNDCEIACDCVKRANVVLPVRLCKEIFARKHTATHKPTSAQPLSAPHSDQRDTHTYIHTRINRLWSPLAYGLGGNNRLWSPLAFGLGGNNLLGDFYRLHWRACAEAIAVHVKNFEIFRCPHFEKKIETEIKDWPGWNSNRIPLDPKSQLSTEPRGSWRVQLIEKAICPWFLCPMHRFGQEQVSSGANTELHL